MCEPLTQFFINMMCSVGMYYVVREVLKWWRGEIDGSVAHHKKSDMFDKKHVVITGGSSGLGLAFAKIAAAKGASVTIQGKGRVELEEAKKEIEAVRMYNSTSVNTWTADLSETTKTSSWSSPDFEQKPDILVCAAGACTITSFNNGADASREQMDLNYFGTERVIRAVLPSMADKQKGMVVSVASIMALTGFEEYTAYAPSKWALRGLMECLKSEYRHIEGLSFHIFYPPNMNTPGFKVEQEKKNDLVKAWDSKGGLQEPEDAARSLVYGLEKGHFYITSNFPGRVLAVASQGTTPTMNYLSTFVLKVISVFLRGWIDSDLKDTEGSLRKKEEADFKARSEWIEKNSPPVNGACEAGEKE